MAILLAVALPAQQRPVTDISGTTQTCQDSRVSPDGQFVAYRAGNRIAVVRIVGGGELTLHASANLGSFVWSPTGGTVYIVDGNRVLASPRTGGGVINVGNLAGQTVWLWDVSSDGSSLFGTRYDPAAFRYHVFRLATSGTQAAQDLFSSQDVLSELRIDPTAQFLLYLQQGVAPFSPISVMRANVDGTNPLDMLGAPLGTFAQGPEWIDGGDTAIVTAVPPAGSLQVMRIDRIRQVAEPLTWSFGHRRTTVSPDLRWIVMESVDGVGGNGPALLPTAGGGEVLLHTGTRYAYAGFPAVDGAGGVAVFSAQRTSQIENARVLRVDLDGEMRVYPRAEIGRPLLFELPCPPSEIGAILLGQRSAPFTLTGIQYDYVLGANFAIIALAAGSASGPVTATVPLPNTPALQGLMVDFQGLRWDPTSQSGAWTRSGRFPIF